MKKMGKFTILTMVLCLLLGVTAPALARTDWNLNLRNNYCTDSRHTAKGWGCAAYIYYRIVQGKSRDASKSTCRYGCDKIKPNEKSACYAGCDQANYYDKGTW